MRIRIKPVHTAHVRIKHSPIPLKRIFLGFLSILLAVIVVFAGCVLILRAQGKKQLAESSGYKAPKLTSEEPVPEVYEEGVIAYEGGHYRYNDDIRTFLVMGIDNRDKLPKLSEVKDFTKGGQADTLFLIVVNPDIKKVNVIAVNRNTMGEVEVYDTDNQFVHTDLLQICLQHGYGSGLEDSCERQVKTVSCLFYDLPIHGYLSIELPAVCVLNDAVDGVEVSLLENIPGGSDAVKNRKGETVTLSGEDAYRYVVYRDLNTFDSSSMRLSRQKQYLKTFAKKAIEKTKKDVTFPLMVYNELTDYTVTDINTSKMTYMSTTYSGYEFDFDNIYTLEGETVIGTGGFEEFYADDDALYDLIIDLFYDKID